MLKVKRPIQLHNAKNEIEEWQNDIKNSIKGLYIKTKKDNQTINQYSDAFQKVKNEYALLYKENQELKKTIQEIKESQQMNPQNYYRQPRKRPLSRFDYANENEEDKDVQYIVQKKRKTPKTKIIYEDDLTDDENDEIDNGEKKEEGAKIEESIEKKTFKKPNKKGTSKIIKM